MRKFLTFDYLGVAFPAYGFCFDDPPAGTDPPAGGGDPPAGDLAWLTSLPTDLQNDPSLVTFKSVEDLSRSYINTKKMVGDRVKVPDENSTPEDRKAFYSRIGVPETPTGYELDKVALPDGISLDAEAMGRFAQEFHEAGVPKAAAERIVKKYFTEMEASSKKMLADYDASVQQQMDTLKARWGANFDKNRDMAMTAFGHYATPALQATVEKEGWGNHPDFVELFHKIAVATGEDVLLQGPTIKQKTAETRIKEIENDPAFNDIRNPARKGLLDERNRLYQELYPEG